MNDSTEIVERQRLIRERERLERERITLKKVAEAVKRSRDLALIREHQRRASQLVTDFNEFERAVWHFRERFGPLDK